MRKIIILGFGFVYVGDEVPCARRNFLRFTNVSNIREWGTTDGLGQLALEGKQPNTVLDACTDLEVHELSVVALIDGGKL
jgi:hypothetical protein